MTFTNFSKRHIGLNENTTKTILNTLRLNTIDELINETIPESILTNKKLKIEPALSEHELLIKLKEISKKNTVAQNYIGAGYHPTITPSVVLRNIFENPNWYTAYTPYQPEISQGRLEALINFQTLCIDLTGMEIANASLLDEGTAAAEAMTMSHRIRTKKKQDATTYYVSDKCFPQTIDIIKTRSEPLGFNLVISDPETWDLNDDTFGICLQYPDNFGQVNDYSELCQKAHENDIKVTVVSDLLSLVTLKPPGEWNADIVVGSTQRFGIPMGFGGPHAAYFATKSEYQRQVPGRIIGLSKDKYDKKAYRMALQTREQHIRRDKATSNICTAQVLLANMAAFYAQYHGPEGLRHITKRINTLAIQLEKKLDYLGFKQINTHYFDTLRYDCDEETKLAIEKRALAKHVNFRYINNSILISINEITTEEDINDICKLFLPIGKLNQLKYKESSIPENLQRKSAFLEQDVFNNYHTESAMMRYMKKLENKDLSLTKSMIPLGSCTMKLNAATEMMPLSWPEYAHIHPFSPLSQVNGYLEILEELNKDLCEITGFDDISMQPNSGAQGEYAGLLVIRAYLKDIGQGHRNIVLIPESAHGTNFATTTLIGMNVVIIKCDPMGNIDENDLNKKVEKHKDNLAAIMITYPSTHGVFEESIKEICDLIHKNGGQVYMDGANMNAQVGLTSPGFIGADVCHLNLHKTFSIPHGGGGPGMGPIGVKSHLTPFLPGHVTEKNNKKQISAVSSAHYGSASITIISYAYIKMLGPKGLKQASEVAILNANYIQKRLEDYYPVLFTGPKGRVAHELIIDLRQFKKSIKLEAIDVAKRLMDYGFHAPTLSWPVPNTLMIEPTESEDLEEINRFCDAMIEIRKEIEEIESGKEDINNNILKNAPHTQEDLIKEWTNSYSKERAIFPLPYVRENKFWPTVSRIDQAYGDRNLICSCSIEDYIEEAVTPS